MINIVEMLNECGPELKEHLKEEPKISEERKKELYKDVDRIVHKVKELLTDHDIKLTIPRAAKHLIKELIILKVADPMDIPGYDFEYRIRQIKLAMEIVVFIHSYK